MMVDERQSAGVALFEEVQARFPDIQLVGIGPSPENPALTVVRVVVADEEQEDKLLAFAAERATARLLEHDQYLIVVPSMFEVEIEFPGAHGDRAKYQSVHAALRRLIEEADAGEMGGLSTGSHGPPVIWCWLRDLGFARTELLERLRDLGVLEEAEVYWAHPYRASGRHGDRTRLYPPEN